FVGTGGRMPAEAVTQMNRDFPAYFAEMESRGVRLCGRELDSPATAVTVRVRDGETLVTDGPFAETKEFVGGFDVLDCADLDEAIEVEAKSPVARFLPLEIRPFAAGLRAAEPLVSAFDREDDSAGLPYLLTVWIGPTPAGPLDSPAVLRRSEAWRQKLEEDGVYVLGGALGGPETATTLRVANGETRLSDGPFLGIEEFIASVDVVRCPDRQRAVDLAAAHPFARYHAVEARPFYSAAIHAQRQLESRE
ncbi:MAG TPA: YciI family protein, partial [Trebonia sp.]